MKLYIIKWTSLKTGVSGRGKTGFDLKTAIELARSLTFKNPKLRHTVCEFDETDSPDPR